MLGVALCLSKRLLQPIDEKKSIRKSGEGVVRRLVMELYVDLLKTISV